jgi:tetratricopeptide (TPR) repeat protein
LIGTDTNVTGFPGRSAQEEIQELVSAGISRYDALLAATKNAGDFVKKTVPGSEPFGTVAVGQRADLILVAANPLENLDNLKQLRGVMVRGRWWSSERIAEMRRALLPRLMAIKKEVARLNTLIDQKKLGEAVDVFRALRTTHPQEVFFHFHALDMKITIATLTKRYPDALELAKMNAELRPDHFAVHVRLGQAYRQVGDKENAEKCFKKSLELCPSNGVALEELEKMHTEQKDRSGGG